MYDASLEDCDILNKDNLGKFRDKRSEWLSWLQGEDQNSVWSQLRALEWNHRIFLMTNECKGIAAERRMPAAALNPLLAEFVNQGYVANQSLGIRKQLERGKKGEPGKQIISLRRTLDDVVSKKSIITRECYVCYDGLPYDYHPIQQEYFEHRFREIDERAELAADLPVASYGPPMKGPLAWSSSERRHEAFDRLSGKSPKDRSRDDEISPRIFCFLYKKIDEDVQHFRDVVQFTHKYVAHAADKISIETLSDDQHGISINKVEACQKALWQVAHYIIYAVLNGPYHGPGITYQGDPLKYLKEPWIHDDHMAEVYDIWKAGEQSRDNWPQEFEAELGSEVAHLSPIECSR